MELESCLASIALLLVMLAHGTLSKESAQGEDSLHNTLVERMDRIQQQLAEVTRSMAILDADIGKTLFNCLDRRNTPCEGLDDGSGPMIQTDQSAFWAPEKRYASENPLTSRNKRELFRKRALVNHLLGVFKGAGNALKDERKRTCNLNLGFHCETEEISNFADMLDFLNSEKSPGKKRSVRSSH